MLLMAKRFDLYKARQEVKLPMEARLMLRLLGSQLEPSGCTWLI
jgi:hypothetical protein